MTIWGLRPLVVNDALQPWKQVAQLGCTIEAVAVSMFNGKYRNGGLVLAEIGSGGPTDKSVESSFSLDPESDTVWMLREMWREGPDDLWRSPLVKGAHSFRIWFYISNLSQRSWLKMLPLALKLINQFHSTTRKATHASTPMLPSCRCGSPQKLSTSQEALCKPKKEYYL